MGYAEELFGGDTPPAQDDSGGSAYDYAGDMFGSQAHSPAPTAASSPQQSASFKQFADQKLGLKDYETRGTILPIGRTKEGKLELALPQVAVDMAESALLPGYVKQGGQYDAGDVSQFALNYGLVPRGKLQTQKEFVQKAPTSDDLAAASKAKFGAAGAGAPVISPDSYFNFLGNLENTLSSDTFDPLLHPKVSAAKNAVEKNIGKPLSLDRVQIIRRQLATAAASNNPDERRLAEAAISKFDDWVDGIRAEDLQGGNIDGAAKALSEARALWAKMRKSEIIDDVARRAEIQASGFDNGVVIGFRRILNTPSLARQFTDDERGLMTETVKGSVGQKVRRFMAKYAPFRSGHGNSFGATSGSVAGGYAAGPIGAVAVPVAGQAANMMANKYMADQLALQRALAATGGRMPMRPGFSGSALRMMTGPMINQTEDWAQ